MQLNCTMCLLHQKAGKTVKAEGKVTELLQEAMAQPADSPARQLAETLLVQQEVALIELGLELGSQYHLSHAEQAQLAAETANNAVPDQTIGELSRLMEQERLTDTSSRDTVETQNTITEEQRLLIQELKANNVKFSEKDMLFITRDPSGQIVWLETGNPGAGLEHILNGNGITKGHREDFENAFGISEAELPAYLERVITNGTIVSNKLTMKKNQPGYERIYYYNGTHCVLAGVGINGFIVSAYPVNY